MEVEKERIRLEKEADELALKESEGTSRCAAVTSCYITWRFVSGD